MTGSTADGVNSVNDDEEADTGAQILQIQAASVQAWNCADLDGHLSVYGDAVTTMTATGPREGVACIRDAFMASYFKDGAAPPQLRIGQISIRSLGENFALMTARYVLQAEGAAEQSGWTTLAWQRTPAGWRVIHDHTS